MAEIRARREGDGHGPAAPVRRGAARGGAPTQAEAHTWRGVTQANALREVMADTRWGELEVLGAIASGDATGFERGEAFADVDRGPELPIDAVDPGVEPPDLGE